MTDRDTLLEHLATRSALRAQGELLLTEGLAFVLRDPVVEGRMRGLLAERVALHVPEPLAVRGARVRHRG
jgi:hypothetical protein